MIHRTILLFVSLGALAACSSDEDKPEAYASLKESGSILQYIPADSDAAFVRLKGMPDELGDIFAEQQRIIAEYQKASLGQVRDQLEQAEGDEAQRAMQVFELAEEMASPEGLQAAGLESEAPFAFYMIDSVPVLRLSVADETALQTKMEEIQALMPPEMQMQDGAVQDVAYRYFDVEKVRIASRLSDGYLVVAGTTVDVSDADLRRVFGLDKPAETLATSGRLADIAAKHDLMDIALGYVEVEALIERVINAAIEASGNADASADNEVCRTELLGMLGGVEQVVAGIREASSRSVKSVIALDLDDELASDMQGMTAPVPGLGAVSDAFLTMGMSINANVVRKLVEKRLEAIAETPFECEAFAEINKAADQSTQFLVKQPTPPFIGDIRGFVMSVDDLDPTKLVSGNLSADAGSVSMLIATDNPESLTAMGMLFVPGFAELGLKTGGEPTAIPAGMFNPNGDPMNVLMTSDRIAVSVGTDSVARVTALGELPAPDDSPLFSMDMNFGGIFSMAMQQTEQLAADNPDFDASVVALLDSLESTYDRLLIGFDVSELGLEFTSEITFKEKAN